MCNLYYTLLLSLLLSMLTWIVHALTSSCPAVKKYCKFSALYPCTIILSSALNKRKKDVNNICLLTKK